MKKQITKLIAAGPIRLLILIVLFSGIAPAQQAGLTLGKGVDPHAGIDQIYRSFSEAYRALRPDIVADLYTVDAAYLSPTREIRIGRDEILKGFGRSFENTKARKRTMSISFRIVQRKVAGELGYDVGIFDLEYFENDESVHRSKGKFVVVTVKGDDGRWRFQVDGYSDIDPPDAN